MHDTPNSQGASHEAPSSHQDGDDQKRIAELEVENGFRQFDLAVEVIENFLEPDRPFALRPTLIQQLPKVAVEGIESRPGEWRNGPVGIHKSKHNPPDPHLVELLVQEMCDYVNENWHEKTAFHLSAYVMWRLNWIHPFSDENGRTSRIVSYLVLCSNLNTLLPGSPSIPQQIQNDRTQYFDALEAADKAFSTGNIDVTHMETFLKNALGPVYKVAKRRHRRMVAR